LLSFHQLILRKFLLIFSILFISVAFIVYYWVKVFYIEQTKEALLNNIKIIFFSVEENNNLDELAQKIKEDLDLRLTLINLDGNILAESHKDKAKMENHKYRVEVVEANTQKYGFIIRHSDTLDKDLLYIAKKYNQLDKPIYIRLSKEIKSINQEILVLGEEILFILILFIIVILFITLKITKSIESEVQKIVNFLTSLTKKNKETYISSSLSIEFYKITSLLTKVSQILVKKEKQKTKFTAKLQISNKQKDDIISAISHEFKNPIAVITGYSQTLMDDTDINPNIRQKFLTKIYKNGLKLSELIDILRLSSKLDSGQQETLFKEVNVKELIEDCVDNIKLNYPKRHTIIKIKNDVNIKADASLLGVVITNLVENAFKYSEDEVVIEIDKHSVNIIDTGIGISKSNLNNITNKFFRVNENSWNNSLGLGLFIVTNILNLHHFKLEIKSKENEGSTFSVKF